MRILVIGANGAVGKQVVKKLLEMKQEPIAMVRDEDQIPYFESIGTKTVLADLEGDFEQAFAGIDAVIFAAGSGGHTGADKTIIVDQEGAVEAVDLAKRHNVKRFIMLSSMRADTPKSATSMKHYLYAKHRADEHLKKAGIPYVILRPGSLTDDPGTGKVNMQRKLDNPGKVPREDVASVLAVLAVAKEDGNKIYELIEGETAIADLL
jgi:uncharacterized protein YbjT (DUF2867 family)